MRQMFPLVEAAERLEQALNEQDIEAEMAKQFTVADAMRVPEVMKLVRYLAQGHHILPTSALLTPFMAAWPIE